VLGDIDFDQQVIHGENAKSKKRRLVPIGTTRLRTLLEWLHIGPNGEQKAPEAFVFTRGDDEAIKSFRTGWERARKAAKCGTVRFHDLRSEYASRLVEHGVPLSQVRDLLGHCSIVVTSAMTGKCSPASRPQSAS
jgi:integrase